MIAEQHHLRNMISDCPYGKRHVDKGYLEILPFSVEVL